VSTDDERRRQLYADVQRTIAEEAPYISLWYKTNVAVAQSSLTGIRIPPIADFTFLRDVSRAPDRAPAH
jgi:ABC-type transport system substrate-binding protein